MKLHPYKSPVPQNILRILSQKGPLELLPLYDSLTNKSSASVAKFKELYLNTLVTSGKVELRDKRYSITKGGEEWLSSSSHASTQDPSPFSGDFSVAAKRTLAPPKEPLSIAPSPRCSRPQGEDFLKNPSVTKGNPSPRVCPSLIPSKMTG